MSIITAYDKLVIALIATIILIILTIMGIIIALIELSKKTRAKKGTYKIRCPDCNKWYPTTEKQVLYGMAPCKSCLIKRAIRR